MGQLNAFTSHDHGPRRPHDTSCTVVHQTTAPQESSRRTGSQLTSRGRHGHAGRLGRATLQSACHRISAGRECALGFRAGTAISFAGSALVLPSRPIYSLVFEFESTHLRCPVKENRKSIVRSFLYSNNPSGVERRQTRYYKARMGEKKKTKTKHKILYSGIA